MKWKFWLPFIWWMLVILAVLGFVFGFVPYKLFGPPKMVYDEYYKGYIIHTHGWGEEEVKMNPDSSFWINDGFIKKDFSKEFIYPEGTAQIIFSKYKAWREAGHK